MGSRCFFWSNTRESPTRKVTYSLFVYSVVLHNVRLLTPVCNFCPHVLDKSQSPLHLSPCSHNHNLPSTTKKITGGRVYLWLCLCRKVAKVWELGVVRLWRWAKILLNSPKKVVIIEVKRKTQKKKYPRGVAFYGRNPPTPNTHSVNPLLVNCAKK